MKLVPANKLIIEKLVVKRTRVVCDVYVPNPKHRRTTPELAAYIVERFPDLPKHTCVNDYGPAFASVIENTSLPHLLEHLVIDLQLQQNAPQATGFSEWIDASAGRARVEVSFTDDLVVLRAFREAARILNEAMIE